MEACRIFIASLLLLVFSLGGYAQNNVLVSSDSLFTMKVYREGSKVKLMFHFNTIKGIDNISVERNDGSNTYFAQCKYMEPSREKLMDTIVKTDNYPLPGITDAFYRLRITTTEGIMRLYPAVKLPAVNNVK
jgi:hypothetical protein